MDHTPATDLARRRYRCSLAGEGTAVSCGLRSCGRPPGTDRAGPGRRPAPGPGTRSQARLRHDYRKVGLMAVNTIVYPSVGERAARGDDARTRTPPSSHAQWAPAADRPDPIALLEEQDLTRE